jgi:TolB protein
MRSRHAALGAIGVILLVLTPLLSPPAGAKPDRHDRLPGVIAFQRYDANGQFQLWVANADLTRQRQLTSGEYTSGYPSWNPDGTRIAFDSNRSDPDLTDDVLVNEVFTMRRDGTEVVQVTDFGGFSGDPDWSRDGQWLAFESDLGDHPASQGIYVSRPDGSDLRRVTTLPADSALDLAPQISPNGRRIVFTRVRSFDEQGNVEESALYVVNADGTREKQLTATADLAPGDATWSPDGKTLVFEAYGPIFTIRADGTMLRNLTRERPDGFSLGSDPVFSPDGRHIMYTSSDRSNEGEILTIGLAVMKADGSRLRYVTDTPTEETTEHQPDWILAPRIR